MKTAADLALRLEAKLLHLAKIQDAQDRDKAIKVFWRQHVTQCYVAMILTSDFREMAGPEVTKEHWEVMTNRAMDQMVKEAFKQKLHVTERNYHTRLEDEERTVSLFFLRVKE